MKRQLIESSLLRSVGYDEASKTLEVEFTSGGVYEYYGVPAEAYKELLAASSHGRYFLANIRDVYPYRRVK